MGNRKWLIAVAAAVLVVAGLAYVGGRTMQEHPHEQTSDDRVQACVDDAMSNLDETDDADLYAATLARVTSACEERVG